MILQINELTENLKTQEEQTINLEQYTRRENLRFNHIPDTSLETEIF